MTIVEELERRILLKKQLIEWTQEDIREMEKKLAVEREKIKILNETRK
jgi:hypothetical protein